MPSKVANTEWTARTSKVRDTRVVLGSAASIQSESAIDRPHTGQAGFTFPEVVLRGCVRGDTPAIQITRSV